MDRTHNTQNLLLKNNEAEISVPQKRNPHTIHATQQSLDRAIFATQNISLASSPRVFATLHLALAFWYPAMAAASSSSPAFHWASFHWARRRDEVFGAAAHLHQQLHGLGHPVAPTLGSAHLSAPPVG